MPEQASSVSAEYDALLFTEIGISVFFGVGICLAIMFLAWRYRAGSEVDRSDPPEGDMRLELLWSGIPLVIALGLFVWSAKLFITMRTAPKNAMELHVIGKQWMWKIQHPGGKREINELHVPVGKDIKLVMSSEDVIHDFFIPAFRVKMDVLPGRYSMLWFKPIREGTYRFFCAEYCGTSHSKMIGRVVVQSPADYASWLSGGGNNEPPEVAGKALFESFRCGTCHREGLTGRGPVLDGLFGKQVRLAGGGMVVADENYLRESILDPGGKIVEGYQKLMPTYRGQIGEEGLMQLIAYLKSIAPDGKQPEEKR